MTSRELLEREHDRIVQLLADRGATAVRIFGSVARGEDEADSDIDLIIELPNESSAGSELMTALGLSEELSRLVGSRVDVVTPRLLRAEVREAALAEAVPL